ncbi:unnamed protein product [Paramecium sonneborni]|uniref:Transmembrane protein n=1 Tax=Paramecium sonneborni TaxID=65129 RepID=A0A8S1PIQ7_9CILI|nr:unnamed protein product [Paramecium sonneborni]
MMHSTFNIKNRVKTDPNQNYIINSLYDSLISNNINTDIAQTFNTLHQIYHNSQINVKYSHIKIALATQSIFNLTLKFTSTKILYHKLILFQNLSNYQRIPRVNKYEFINNRQLQLFQGLNKLKLYTVLIQKKQLLNLSHHLLIKKKINNLFNRIAKQIYQNKLIAIFQLFYYSKKEKSLLENLNYYYSNKSIKDQERMSIKFASTTLFIQSINNKKLQYQSVFFIKLCEPAKLQQSIISSSLEDISINYDNSRTEELEIAEKKLNAICIFNQVIKKVVKKSFLSLKLHNLNNFNRGQSNNSSILNSQSGILRKLIRSGESILELYQSTNNTEQSKKDQEQDEIILKRKQMMCQTHHPEPIIKQRISIFVQTSQKIEKTKRESQKFQTVIISKKKSKFLLFLLISIIFGIFLILRIVQ